MLFAKKSTNTTRPLDPALDVTDVIDVSEVTRVTSEAAPLATDSAAKAPRGVFLDTKPAAAPEQPAKSLRARFLNKETAVKAVQAEVSDTPPAAKDKPAAEAVANGATSKKARFPWRKAAAVAATTAPTAVDAGPIGPTEHVRKPIIVRKATDKVRKFQDLPIRLFIGYLPEVTERDARDYARGIAERNCDQISLVFFDAYPLNDGYAYEVQEGGAGRAFLPEIIKHFDAQGRFEKGTSDSSVFIRTATRTVQVDRTREGLQAFQLPESATATPTDWLEGTAKMTSAVQTMTSVLVVGAAIFITGFLAMTVAMVSRIQPYEAPPAAVVERATDGFNQSPLSRWTTLQGVTGDEYVKALRFSKGKWELDRGTAPAEAAPETSAATAPSAAAPTPTN